MTQKVNRNQVGGITDNILSMMKGPDPSDNALFMQRLLKAQGNELDNLGTQRKLDANLGMAGNIDMATQLVKSAGLDPSNMNPESVLQFASFFANAENPNLPALGLSTTGGGVDARTAAAQQLGNDQSMADVMLDIKNQEFFNKEDEGIHADELNTQDILLKDAERKKIEAEAAGIRLGTGEGGRKDRLTEADIDLTGAKKTTELAKTDSIINEMGLATAESDQKVQKLVNESEQINQETQNSKQITQEKLLGLQASRAVDQAKVEQISSAIANGDMESALEGIQIVEKTNAIKLESEKKRGLISKETELAGEQIKLVKQRVNNLIAEKTNKDNESGARVRHTDGKTDLTSAMTTQTQVETATGADLTNAKTNYWNNKGEGELADIMLKQSTGAAGKGSGKNQFDYRKTKNAAQMQYNIEDVGVEYTLEKPGKLWGTNDETFYLWPEDNDAVRGILSPVIGSGDEKAVVTAMAQAKQALSKAGLDDPEKVQAIIKQILQVTPTPE